MKSLKTARILITSCVLAIAACNSGGNQSDKPEPPQVSLPQEPKKPTKPKNMASIYHHYLQNTETETGYGLLDYSLSGLEDFKVADEVLSLSSRDSLKICSNNG